MTHSEIAKIPAWILPTIRHAVAFLIALSGPALMLAALAASLVMKSPLIGACGLLGGALLTACGGIGLLWSLGNRKAG